MARNSLKDLNDHLFEQLERLNDESLSDEDLAKEINRSQAMCSISNAIIGNAEVAIKAQKMINEYGDNSQQLTPLISFMSGKK